MKATQTKVRRMVARAAGCAVVAALSASAPAAHASSEVNMVVGVFASNATMSVSTHGCEASPVTHTACQTTIRAYSGLDSAYPCAADTTMTNGDDASGPCTLGRGMSAGYGTANVANRGCDDLNISELSESRMNLTDANGTRWSVDGIGVHATNYRHAGVADVWTLDPGAGLTVQGSWIHAVNGRRQLWASLNGTMTSLGSCAVGAGSSDYTMAVAATGWIVTPL